MRIGILGAGQLASLLGNSIKEKHCELILYAQSLDEPACSLADKLLIGEQRDKEKLLIFFENCDVVLLESEFYSPELLQNLEDSSGVKVYPNLNSYKRLYSKANQKRFFNEINIPNAKYLEVNTINELKKLDFDGPYMLKVSHGGYDGYGNFVIETKNELTTKIIDLLQESHSVIIEEMIDIDQEFAMMLIKSEQEMVVLPACKTYQENSICKLVDFPSGLSHNEESVLESYLTRIGANLPGTGIYAFEFFKDKKGRFIVNEAAPRVHNSYHFSMEGFSQSQFDLFVDAVLGVPLDKPKVMHKYLTMVNLLGQTEGENYQLRFPDIEEDINLKIHLYGKKISKLGRKMGHLTLFSEKEVYKIGQKINQEYQL